MYLVEVIKFFWCDNTAKKCSTLEMLSWSQAHSGNVHLAVDDVSEHNKGDMTDSAPTTTCPPLLEIFACRSLRISRRQVEQPPLQTCASLAGISCALHYSRD